MRFISGLCGLLILVTAVTFALSNRQETAIGLWPFAAGVTAPLYLLILLSLAGGLAAGALFAWLAMLPHQIAASRLQRDIGELHGKLDALRESLRPATAPPPTPRIRWFRRGGS